MPLRVARTIPAPVGESQTVALWASAMAFSLRCMLPVLRRDAHSAMYDATDSGDAGTGHRLCESHQENSSSWTLLQRKGEGKTGFACHVRGVPHEDVFETSTASTAYRGRARNGFDSR